MVIIMIVLTRPLQSLQTGGQHTVYYVMEGTATGWQGVEWARVTPHRTKYHACVVGGVGGRMMILQNHDG